MILVLYQPDIPQNTGALVRLSSCLGIELHIIEPCGFVLDDKKLQRAALDYGPLATLVRHRSWADFKAFCTGQQARLILLSTKASVPYADFCYRPNDMLLLGRESAGVPPDVHAAADGAVRIPMQPGARSLNVAMSAGMVLGEGLRQTKGFIE